MKALLDDLLDVSRLKLGHLELARERVRLSAVVSGAVETTGPLLSESGHSLTVYLPPGDIEIDGDALRLGQVVTNLLANAFRYTPRGGRVVLRAHYDDGSLQISVKDSGIGMAPDRIEAMFELFTQGDTVAGHSQGLGIGLALVKQLVELHGGEVHAYSEGVGKGCEFRISLPHARPFSGLPPSPGPDATGPKKSVRVLVADDNVDAGWGLAKLLELRGFETLRVHGGLEALEAMREHNPQAAVIDIGMPDLGGHEVARRARAAPWGRSMVLIAATGWGQEADEQAALAAGFDAHMTKPVNVQRLSNTIDTLLAARRR
jgi:two-component system CheB/CheR fusion protein